MKQRIKQFTDRTGTTPLPAESSQELCEQFKPFVLPRPDGDDGLFIEEVQELIDAVLAGDVVELVDAVKDIGVYYYQFVNILESAGVDYQGVSNLIADNNDMKYTTSYELAQRWELETGYKVESNIVFEGYEEVVYHCIKDDCGKIKKFKGFEKVNLLPFIPEVFVSYS